MLVTSYAEAASFSKGWGWGGGMYASIEYFKFTRDNPILKFFTNYIKTSFFKTDPHVQCTFFAK